MTGPAALVLLAAALAVAAGGDVSPPRRTGMARAHSHNDYEQAEPLLDALAHGFSSVEADVWWSEGRVRVAHMPFAFKGTLEDLYLEPLQARVDRLGSVHGDGRPFHLWIDVKQSSAGLEAALGALLARYPMFAGGGGPGSSGPVVPVLTGDERVKRSLASRRDLRAVRRDSTRYSHEDPPSDGRWTWYALRWRDHFSWDGRGRMPEEERVRLRAVVAAAHGKGRRLRIFHAPEREALWSEALGAGVDLVGTDHLAALRRFLEHADGALAAAW
jgi:hypothetical protein